MAGPIRLCSAMGDSSTTNAGASAADQAHVLEGMRQSIISCFERSAGLKSCFPPPNLFGSDKVAQHSMTKNEKGEVWGLCAFEAAQPHPPQPN